MEQRTDEWLLSRLGKVTSSRIANVMATIKNGEAASRRNYKMQLVVERLTGIPSESYVNGDMQRGIDLEPEARAAYEFITDNVVTEVGFIDHPTISMSGASPDGVIEGGGLIEIKCAKTATHVDYMLSGEPPTNYVYQMQWQMACTGAQWCDFVSYDPRMPVHRQLFIVRVARDQALIDKISCEVIKFLAEVSEITEKLAA